MMKGTKRPSTSPNDDREKKKKKKLQIRLNERTSLTCIEHFSNELFYEIFDYLDGIDIYNTFTDLNYCFHQILTSPSLLLKIKLNDWESNKRFPIKYKHFLQMNKHQIFSLSLSKSTSHGIQLNLLISLLLKLTRLPCLFSLTINGLNTFHNLTNIYRLIYALPKLKYNKFCYHGDHSFTSLSKAKEKHFSPLEYLILDHPCTFQELFSLISYTPHLHRLTFLHKWFIHDENFNQISSIDLPYLSHLTVNSYYGTFDDLQIFISKIHCKLTIFNLFIVSPDITFLSGDRWERFLIQYLPHLVEFSFKYSLSFAEIQENVDFDRNMQNQFHSSFWIQQNWILDVEIDFNAIVYSIKPFWKHFNRNLQWFSQQQDYSMELSNKLSKSTRLVIIYELFNDNMDDLLSYIDHNGGLFLLTVGGGGGPIDQTLGVGIHRMVQAAVFPIGLIMIVTTGADLFTGNTMSLIISTLDRKTTLINLIVSWIVSYFGNLVGCLFFQYIFVYYAGLLSNEPYRSFTMKVAESKSTIEWHQILLRGIAGNWLVCLALWMGTSARELS
ncbi:unnamed protein product [Adineta ricciae]|uniref:F-box domain-containing protein n=1 Tax=Adineta ricciae TaxID=249248 RepID=A0A815TTU1_ADIRI|nr:unnamed protein product [Adineta ricciae]